MIASPTSWDDGRWTCDLIKEEGGEEHSYMGDYMVSLLL